MAERSRRTGSRRATPQPTVERKVRATRSQSHDISESEEVSRTGRRHKNEAHAPRSTKGAAAAKAWDLDTFNDHGLPTVAEEPRSAPAKHQLSRKAELNERRSAAGPAKADRKSLGGASAMSGTTARMSNSAQELEDLRSENLLDAILSIIPETENLLDLLVSGDRWDVANNQIQIKKLCEELASKNSRTQKQFNRLSQKFQVPWEEFDTGTFIDIGASLNALFGSHASQQTAQEAWRPDPLLQKTNAASFALALYMPKDISDDVELWTSTDQVFPRPFLSEHETLNDDARNSTLMLAIEIRTQHVIRVLTQDLHRRDLIRLSTVDEVFKEGKSLKGWDFDSFQSQQLDETSRTAIQERLKAIRTIIQNVDTTDSRNSDIVEKLTQQYPWIEFLDTTTRWLRARVIEIDHSLEIYGGSAKVLDALGIEIKKIKMDRPVAEQGSQQEDMSPDVAHVQSPEQGQVSRAPAGVENEPLPRKTRAKELNPQSPKSNALAAKLFARTMSANRSVNQSATVNQAGSENIAIAGTSVQDQQRERRPRSYVTNEQLDSLQAQNLVPSDDEDDSEQISPDVIQEIVQTSASQQAESNKENELHSQSGQAPRSAFLYNHPQPDARREVWEESEVENTPLQDVTTHQNRRRSEGHNGTRKRPSPEFEDVRQSPAKRVRQAGGQRERDRDRDRVAGTAPPGLAEVTAGEVYREANLAAKARVASRGKPAQSRVPWSEEESGRLMDLIQDYGCGWSQLKDADRKHPHGPLLANRDQVALKDKANNMKVDFLKAARNLPHPHWDHVSLRSNMVAKLRDLGIPYDRETGRREDADLYEHEEDERQQR